MPSEFQANVWGVTPAGEPDLTRAFGDVDNDTVLDLISPVSLLKNVIWLDKEFPPSPHLAYRILINDATMRYSLVPTGSRTAQIIVFALLASLPILTAIAGVWAYRHAFYAVKFNRIGQTEKHDFHPLAIARSWHADRFVPEKVSNLVSKLQSKPIWQRPGNANASQVTTLAQRQSRRTVLIATMEYDIEDWAIKIKIGGLGVMAQLMSKHLQHLDLVWVVPCVGGIDYPIDQHAKPMIVTILDVEYTIAVQVGMFSSQLRLKLTSLLPVSPRSSEYYVRLIRCRDFPPADCEGALPPYVSTSTTLFCINHEKSLAVLEYVLNHSCP